MFSWTTATTDPSEITIYTNVTSFLDPPSIIITDSLGDTTTIAAFGPVVTPLPAALPLFAGGLSLMGLLGRRRKRKGIIAAV